MIDHSGKAAVFNRQEGRVDWHDESLWYIRQKRDKARDSVENWEQLRDTASAIKDHVLENLRDYLIEFEKNLRANGWHVHWARDGKVHNKIVHQLLSERDIHTLVKSKSMLTEECGLNPFLKSQGIEVIDTDLGERIVQLAEEPPSHIVLPAIHKKKREISSLFQQKYHAEPGNEDPDYLTSLARKELKNYFLQSRAALSGVNFGLAGSGGVVICTNEGNADKGIHQADIYIASMGIEKLIPGRKELAVFLKLLARSATGQAITTYTSHLFKPAPGKEFHLILVDNGRSEILKQNKYRETLKCIRCGACINTCPVYRRSGGYSYGYTIPGPIGSVLAPQYDLNKFYSLPYASSLCGSCSDVCPVKINIHEILYRLRADAANRNLLSRNKKLLLKIMGWFLNNLMLYRAGGFLMRKLLKRLPGSLLYNRFNTWGKSREMPIIPQKSFKEWYKKNHCNG